MGGIFGLDFGLGDTGIGSWLSENIVDLLPVGLATAGVLGSNDPEVPYSQTEAAFNQQLALDREELANRMAIAQLQAGAAGAGSGAAIQAAKIAAASQMAQLREKNAADAIMKRIELLQAGPQFGLEKAAGLQNAIQNRNALAQNGYNQLANIIAQSRV